MLSHNGESSLTWACIDGPFLAQVRRIPCFSLITEVTLMTLYRQFVILFILCIRENVKTFSKLILKNYLVAGVGFEPTISGL